MATLRFAKFFRTERPVKSAQPDITAKKKSYAEALTGGVPSAKFTRAPDSYDDQLKKPVKIALNEASTNSKTSCIPFGGSAEDRMNKAIRSNSVIQPKGTRCLKEKYRDIFCSAENSSNCSINCLCVCCRLSSESEGDESDTQTKKKQVRLPSQKRAYPDE